jgi:phosphatidylserine/phosphatidylglycerophosphate/cardiolipin synthase-like enzyme
MLRRFSSKNDAGLMSSQLYDEQSFYPAFLADIKRAALSIIIESPFISQRRLDSLYPALQRATKRGIAVTINTRDPRYHDVFMRQQATDGIAILQDMGITVLFTVNLHRKLVVIDRQILYEGSLNVLSHTDSSEVMRRIESADLADQMLRFTGLERWYT